MTEYQVCVVFSEMSVRRRIDPRSCAGLPFEDSTTRTLCLAGLQCNCCMQSTFFFFRRPADCPFLPQSFGIPAYSLRPNVQSLQTGGNTLVQPSNPQPHPNHRSHVGPNALGPDRTLFEAFWMPSAGLQERSPWRVPTRNMDAPWGPHVASATHCHFGPLFGSGDRTFGDRIWAVISPWL